ncbi:MAG: DUF3570 domain-containing protein, partial [Gammaproteobacteria bacterium]|nr:DUF3570 domain-containing protein [Gammaproteobacteria bacterium]
MALKMDRAAAVAVIKTIRLSLFFMAVFFLACQSVIAAVLPEERADVLYHSYDGGGVEVSGPSILVRKGFNESISASANYYVDTISSASIDVMTTASPYAEERIEKSVSMDYLHANTTMSLGYTISDENDYHAKTVAFNLSQELFGNMTNVTMGYALADDVVEKRSDATFSRDVKRHQFRAGVSQILSKSLIADFAFETVSDEGYLNNPYRSVRYLDAGNLNGYSYESEVYPRTRISNAVAGRVMYYLPYRASIHLESRIFNDSWGITANHYQIGYSHAYQGRWIFDLTYRAYSQTKADF